MTMRKGIYVVPTDRWYIERTVWLIAGVVLLACTAAGGAGQSAVDFRRDRHRPGLDQCRVHRLLPDRQCAQAARLQSRRWRRRTRGKLYFLQTDSWYLERRIYVTVGVNITLGSILFLLHSPWWGLFTGFVGAAMVWFAATGLCILANVLFWIGAEPRLNPGALRAGHVGGSAKHA